jgi:hypothetical protein
MGERFNEMICGVGFFAYLLPCHKRKDERRRSNATYHKRKKEKSKYSIGALREKTSCQSLLFPPWC